MTKELTDKMKEEIVESQINYLKKQDNNGIINYDWLKRGLTEGINEYPLEKGCLNEEIDYDLMRKIEKDLGGKKFIRLNNAFQDFCNILRDKNPKNKDLLDFYNKAEESLVKNGGYFDIRNYGTGCHKLLTIYLKEKELIKTPIKGEQPPSKTL